MNLKGIATAAFVLFLIWAVSFMLNDYNPATTPDDAYAAGNAVGQLIVRYAVPVGVVLLGIFILCKIADHH